MKSQLLSQILLTGMVTFSMVACQKSDDSAPTAQPATQSAPAPTDTTTEAKPKTALDLKNEAEAALQIVGLKFAEQPATDATDLYMVEAKWDVGFYRDFLKKTDVKPTLETQVQLLKTYCDAVDHYIEQDLKIEPQDMDNESPSDIAMLAEKAESEARLSLAQARLDKLEKRLEAQKKKDATPATAAPATPTPAPTADPKNTPKPETK
jgi:hypothetical protein